MNRTKVLRGAWGITSAANGPLHRHFLKTTGLCLSILFALSMAQPASYSIAHKGKGSEEDRFQEHKLQCLDSNPSQSLLTYQSLYSTLLWRKGEEADISDWSGTQNLGYGFWKQSSNGLCLCKVSSFYPQIFLLLLYFLIFQSFSGSQFSTRGTQ